jgi:hypothetical protein
VFGLSRTTASKYALVACGLLDGQPAEGTGAQHHAPGGPGGIPALTASDRGAAWCLREDT